MDGGQPLSALQCEARPSRPRPRRELLVSVQHLRAVAALAVVLYHILQWRAGGFEIGRAGVDLFFVVSGLIIWQVAGRGGEGGPARFLWRRASRVVPAYWFATLLLAAIVLVWPAFLPKVRPEPRHILLSLAFIPHLDPMGLPFPLLSPGWTLSYEAGFYLLLAAALVAPRRWRAWLIGMALVAVVFVGVLAKDPVYVLGANPLVLEFGFGLGIALAADAGALPSRRGSVVLLALGFGALVVSGLTGWRSEVWRFVLWGVPAAAIVLGAVGLEGSGGWPRAGPFRQVGDASYSLYLFHPIALAAVAHAIGWRSPLFSPAALAAALAAGFAGRYAIELPAMRLMRGRNRAALSSP